MFNKARWVVEFFIQGYKISLILSLKEISLIFQTEVTYVDYFSGPYYFDGYGIPLIEAGLNKLYNCCCVHTEGAWGVVEPSTTESTSTVEAPKRD